MYRDKLKELEKWRKSKTRKPLIIRGARQVGKTWLAKKFGRMHYKNVAYIYFFQNQRMRDLFESSPTTEQILLGLKAESGIDIEPEKTLIIFDEIQEVPAALSALKYIYETAPEYQIIATGSLLGVSLHSENSFPVGKVDYLDLRPLSYHEFLAALGETQLLELLDRQNYEMIAIFKNRFIDLLKQYYLIGGMPEVVKDYVANKSFKSARVIQKKILADYKADFGKHVPKSQVPRLNQVWESIPKQLAKENNKFVYGVLREGARSKEYEQALWWLEDAGLVTIIKRIEAPKLPLVAYISEPPIFKMFLVDVGLLSAMGNISERIVLEKNELFEEFKGSLTEQFVLNELLLIPDIQINYWSRDDATAELDFVVQLNDEIVPIEVKAEENLNSKSLRVFADKYAPKHAVRTSMSNYRKDDWLTNIPLYMIGGMAQVLFGAVSSNNEIRQSGGVE
ncbi:MAG: AAA family ATPase [Candidatus Nomurabacteria bacterium]|jgi:predicted AAA+ superfamily ATPase|nr:AAA family ATPase [Candidatus Nomurabacteria bacterium]